MSLPNVYLFVPNLIGYVRVLFTIASYFFFFHEPGVSLALYFVAFVLDGVDGHAARYFKQCTRFGAALDMITDRAATTGLVLLLTHLQPPWMDQADQWKIAFVGSLLVGLDLVSHYVRMYSCGGVHASHKEGTRNPLLRVYYSNKAFMLSACLGQEGFYLLWYCCVHYPGADFLTWPFRISVPFMVLKQVCNVVQLIEGLEDIVEMDVEDLRKKQEKAQ
eukprot:TRINITY_DN719_c0_g1_i1.p1 TRINITY_DN719_c0_g1~~TRINITY_DN719_c0_g1_i1.p1  ORF type:complete len:219 (+),score=96.72 TRINITY_DN719_c0_g1_i1:103-759(+)